MLLHDYNHTHDVNMVTFPRTPSDLGVDLAHEFLHGGGGRDVNIERPQPGFCGVVEEDAKFRHDGRMSP